MPHFSDSLSHIIVLRAQHKSIHGSPVLEPVGLVNMWDRHLDPNRFKHRITWPADDYLQVTCVYRICTCPKLHDGPMLPPGGDEGVPEAGQG